MTFGERLKLLRYEKGLTQDDLGYILKVTKACISCYENGTRQPSIEFLIKISMFFQVSVDFLVGFDAYSGKRLQRVNLTSKDLELLTALKSSPSLYEKIMENVEDSALAIKNIFE